MREEIARGAAWMLLFRLFDRSIGILSTTILARLLIPADFGLVAMAMSVISIVELATSFSFEIALIQKTEPKREHYDTAWTLNILVALGGATLTAMLAYPAAHFYGDERLVAVMFCIAAGWIVSGLENPAIANFRRRMDFGAEFRFMSAKRVVMFVVGMAAAFTLRSYWALVIGMITGRVVGTALSFAMEPFRPRLTLSCARELFSFSGWLLVNNVANVVLGRLPHFAVGRAFGPQTLGAYTVGSEIAQLAHTELIAPINRAMFPGYARLVSDPETFRRVCTEATALILLVALPASFAVALFAGSIVRVLLGDQWHDAVPVIQVLAFSGAVSAITSNNLSVYLALGRPHVCTVILASRLVLFVAAYWLFARGRGVAAVAYSELFAALGSLIVSLPILFRALRISTVAYLGSLWRPLVASTVAAAIVYRVFGLGGNHQSFIAEIGNLLVGLPFGGVAYVGVLWMLWRLSGRPQSVEWMIGRRVWAALHKLVAKVRPSAG